MSDTHADEWYRPSFLLFESVPATARALVGHCCCRRIAKPVALCAPVQTSDQTEMHTLFSTNNSLE